jgi:glyoxylase I family protein
MQPIASLHHVAVCVTDIDRAKRFYSEVLGLTEVARPDFPFAGAWYELPNGTQIHLIVHDGTLTMRRSSTIDIKDGHLALRVPSYAETLAHLQKQGVEVIALPTNRTAWAQLYIADPDGNIVELNAERD